MPTTTDGIPYPSNSDPVDVPGDLQELAEAVVSKKGGSTISASSTAAGLIVAHSGSGAALEVRNTGTGNSLVVEDSANPDSSPFVIDASGRILIGQTSTSVNAGIQITSDSASAPNSNIVSVRRSTDATSSALVLQKARGSLASPTVVASGDGIGSFQMSGYDGTNMIAAAQISAEVDGTPGTNDMPGRLVFSTTADGASTPTERMRITNAGNVGIGTSSPATRFHSIGAPSGASMATSGTTDSTMIARHQGGVVGIDAGVLSSGTSYLQVRNVNDLSVGYPLLLNPNGGNVGIGTSSPNSALHIEFDGANQTQLIRNSSDATSAQLLFRKRRGTSSSPLVVSDGDAAGLIGFQAYDGTAVRFAAQIAGFIDGTPGLNDMPGRLVFSTTADGSATLTERMRITSAGNVGIGTSSPQTIFHLEQNSALQFRLARNSSDTGPNNLYAIKRRGTTAAPTIVTSGDGVLNLYGFGYDGSSDQPVAGMAFDVDGTPAAGDMPGRISFSTTPDGSATLTERMRINNAGLITGTGTSLGAWTAYTPTLGGTGWAIGNGTATGAYCQIGKIVHFRARIVFGSTSTAGAGASPSLTMPVASAGAGSVWPITGRILDASASLVYLIAWQPVSTTVCQLNTIGTNGLQGQINSTTPFTWAVSDELMLTGTYEAA